ncbi:MAG: hypothetical protein GQ469_07570 [Methanosarcinales archaeon]|nr:hypothetical protein [Methanosarcinales archaeon]
MKQIKALLLLIVIFSMVTAVQAEVAQYETVSKMAEDTNCKAVCHSKDTHVIHEMTSATCQGCHGKTLTDRQPSCYKCHTGSIHNVHIKKVQTEDCSYCHAGLDSLHLEMMSDTLCAHCHGDLLDVHGGPTESCEKCHGSAADIVSPVTGAGDIIVCQGCHVSADVAVLHGEATDPNSCYRCHRPGSVNVSASEIPHFIHIPDVACEKCHIDQGTGKIMIPECILCHSVESLHGYNQISLKTSSTGLKCSVCHPMVKDEPATVAPTPVLTATVDSGVATTEDEGNGVPGFGILTAITSLTALYLIRRIKN